MQPVSMGTFPRVLAEELAGLIDRFKLGMKGEGDKMRTAGTEGAV